MPMRTISITSDRLLLVEGRDEQLFCEGLLVRYCRSMAIEVAAPNSEVSKRQATGAMRWLNSFALYTNTGDCACSIP